MNAREKHLENGHVFRENGESQYNYEKRRQNKIQIHFSVVVVVVNRIYILYKTPKNKETV